MSLTRGARFGTYEIAALIGVGGMGEVYRARDTSLKRDVALKVLPATLANDHDRLARLQREAELLAALNHANVAQIHGLERSDGTLALVMELVEGQTLAERIAEGPIPPDEALRLALQIAAALEAAHERGIIHRDLKPANIKLTSEGAVKVLDFGIAKALDTRVTSGPHSPAHTTPAMTEAGIVLGTAAYMSPEQARGKPVDQRADIWAFGCVLYEMLTGRPAFGGEDVTVVLARVLERGPDLSALPATVSPAVRTTLALCLERDPRRRLHAISDVRLALEGRFESQPPIAALVAAPRPLWRRALPLAAVAVVTALVVGVASWFAMQPEPRPVRRFAHNIPADQAFRNTERPVLAVSPDGRHFVYNTRQGLFLRSLDQLEARLIPGTEENLFTPFFSADGQFIAYRTGAPNQLKRIAVSGGAPVVIGDLRENLLGASWPADGRILFGDTDGIYRVSANGGAPQRLIAEGPARLYAGTLLPDGDSVLVTERSATGVAWDTAEIVVRSLATGARTVLVRGGADARYLPTGHLVYAQGDTLFGIAFNAKTLTLSGGPVPLVRGVMRADNQLTAAANFGVTADGTLVYVSGESVTRRTTLVWVDRAGREQPIDVPPRSYIYAQLSPDGTRVALDSRDEDYDIWILDLERVTLQRLTFDPGLNRSPIWSPDGARVAFTAVVDGAEVTYWQAADGSGVAEQLIAARASGDVEFASDFSADGTALLYNIGINDFAIERLDATADAQVVATPASERNPTLSPDGRWLAYQSNASGPFEIIVRPFPALETGGPWQVSTNGGTRPEWRRDGRELFYFREDTGSGAEVVAVPIEPGDTFRSGAPVTLFRGHYLAQQSQRGIYDVTADGQRFLMIKRAEDGAAANAPQIVIVENWFEELKRLVPTD